MTRTIAAAIVGCGRMGRERALRLQRSGANVILFIDESIDRAKALAAGFPDAIVATSVDEVRLQALDAMFVCTPPGARREPMLAATRAGAALFLEKPIAATIEDAMWMRHLVAETKTLTSVGYMNRWRSGVQRAREVAKTTSVLGIACHWTGRAYGVPWWRQGTLSGGPINEQATHLVDLCRYVAGEIVDVEARCSVAGETATALFTFESGALGTLLYTCGAPEKGIGLQLFTAGGPVYLDGWDFRLTRDLVEWANTANDEDPFGLEVHAFLDAIRSGDRSKIRSDVADAFETQHVMSRLLASTRIEREAAVVHG